MILMIDNYDSFTYNLVQYIEQIGIPVKIKRNDQITIPEIERLAPKAIVISPGPGRPESAGISVKAVQTFSGIIPIMGVCLGHQSIAEAFGGRIIPARSLMHGKTSLVSTDGETIFKGINKPFTAMRYHSLSVSKTNFPDCLMISAKADDGEIMGIRHKEHPTEGIQFHPESIMTTMGKRIIRNFIKRLTI